MAVDIPTNPKAILLGIFVAFGLFPSCTLIVCSILNDFQAVSCSAMISVSSQYVCTSVAISSLVDMALLGMPHYA